MSIRQQWKIRVWGCVHINNNSGNAAIYALVKLSQGFYKINISVSVINQKHKPKIWPGFLMS